MDAAIFIESMMTEIQGIIDQAKVELERAERYRIFVSLIFMDLSFVSTFTGDDSHSILSELEQTAKDMIRSCDTASVTAGGCLALLYPETNRDGAEVGARRISEALRDRVAELSERPLPEVIPLEIASYPDAAGAKSIDELLATMRSGMEN